MAIRPMPGGLSPTFGLPVLRCGVLAACLAGWLAFASLPAAAQPAAPILDQQFAVTGAGGVARLGAARADVINRGGSVFVDGIGNLYATATLDDGTQTDIAVYRIMPDGSLAWETIVDLSDIDEAGAVTVTPFGEVFVTGTTEGTFGDCDIALIKLDVDGSIIDSVTFDGGFGDDFGVDLVYDVLGDCILVAGEVESNDADVDAVMLWFSPLLNLKNSTTLNVNGLPGQVVADVGVNESFNESYLLFNAETVTNNADLVLGVYQRDGTFLYNVSLDSADDEFGYELKIDNVNQLAFIAATVDDGVLNGAVVGVDLVTEGIAFTTLVTSDTGPEVALFSVATDGGLVSACGYNTVADGTSVPFAVAVDIITGDVEWTWQGDGEGFAARTVFSDLMEVIIVGEQADPVFAEPRLTLFTLDGVDGALLNEGAYYDPTLEYTFSTGFGLAFDEGRIFVGGEAETADGMRDVLLLQYAGEGLPAVANDDLYEVPFDTTLDVAAPGVLGNDETDSVGLDIALFTDVSDLGGIVEVFADGGFIYEPPPDAIPGEVDTFEYIVIDGFGTAARGFVDVEILDSDVIVDPTPTPDDGGGNGAGGGGNVTVGCAPCGAGSGVAFALAIVGLGLIRRRR